MSEPTATTLAVARTITGLTASEITDDNLLDLLDLHASNIKLASADALEVVAGQLVTAVTSDDISLDGSKRAAVLMSRAARLRQQAAQETADSDDGFYFGVVGGVDHHPELTERGYL